MRENDTSVPFTSSTHSYYWLKTIFSSIVPFLNCSLSIDTRIYLPLSLLSFHMHTIQPLSTPGIISFNWRKNMSSSITPFLPHCSASFDTRCCILQLTLCLPLLPLSFHTAWPLLMLGIISFLYRLFPFKLFQRWASHARIYSLLSPLLMPDTVTFNWCKNISSFIAFFLPCSFNARHHMQEYIFFYRLFWCWASYLQLKQEYIFLYCLFPSTLFWHWALHTRIYLLLLPLLTPGIVSFNWCKNISFSIIMFLCSTSYVGPCHLSLPLPSIRTSTFPLPCVTNLLFSHSSHPTLLLHALHQGPLTPILVHIHSLSYHLHMVLMWILMHMET